MSSPIRNRRKKTFKKKEEREMEQWSAARASARESVDDKQGEETYSLNIRRSSRKPKPRKHGDDEDVSTGQELTEKASEYVDFDALMKSDELEPSGSSSSGVRRETRKTYQHYLETLGYNADFSKISFSESIEQAVKSKVGSGQRNTVKISKSEERTIAKQLSFPSHLQSEKAVVAEENSASTKVRTSSRTPKPKRTFALLEDDSDTKDSDSIQQNVNDSAITLESEMKSFKIVREEKASSDNNSQGQKGTKKCRRHNMASSMVQDSSTKTPLSKLDVDQTEVLFDAEDQLRTSTRVRIPKRKFSLIEESLSTKRKRQKLMSPEHTTDVEVCGEKELPEKVLESDDGNLQTETQSSLVTKRSSSRKQTSSGRKVDLRGNSLDTDIEKVERLSKKMDNLSSNSEPENNPNGKREKQRLGKQPIVPKLKISKDTAVVKDSKKSKKNDNEDDEEEQTQASNSRKHLKRKRGSHDLEKSASEKEEKGLKTNHDLEKGVSEKEGTKNDSKEHIVLKLTIPHGSPKSEENEKGHEKHHKHHHHHKHKKESENDKKKNKSDGGDHVLKSKKNSDKDLEVMAPVIKAKKKKNKKGSKDESSESLSSDNSATPHVKLVIKKSPIKPMKKDAIKNDPPKITKPSSQVCNEQNIQSDKPSSKVKSSAKEDKPTSKGPKKKVKKNVDYKTVSAYSLFTKGRRKKLLELEPDLDFASTSRRLSEMWKELSLDDKEYWRLKALAIRTSNNEKQMAANGKGKNLSRKGRQDSDSASKESDVGHSSGTDAVDMAAYLKLLGESLCSIGMCLKRQDQMEVHGSLSVLLDTALCSIVPLFCLTSQLPEMAGCPQETQAQILDNLAYIIPGL